MTVDDRAAARHRRLEHHAAPVEEADPRGLVVERRGHDPVESEPGEMLARGGIAQHRRVGGTLGRPCGGPAAGTEPRNSRKHDDEDEQRDDRRPTQRREARRVSGEDRHASRIGSPADPD